MPSDDVEIVYWHPWSLVRFIFYLDVCIWMLTLLKFLLDCLINCFYLCSFSYCSSWDKSFSKSWNFEYGLFSFSFCLINYSKLNDWLWLLIYCFWSFWSSRSLCLRLKSKFVSYKMWSSMIFGKFNYWFFWNFFFFLELLSICWKCLFSSI